MIGIKIITLIFAILSSTSTSLIMFDQNAQGQTPTLTIDYTCNENNVPIGPITLNGFPEGNTVLTRNDLQPPFLHLATFIVPSSGSFTITPDFLVEGTIYTAFSDPNNNLILDPGEVSASSTVTISCNEPPTSPPQQIQNLINTINNLNLDNSLKNSLTAPLNQAVNILEDNNPGNDGSVCNQLTAFIQQVNAQTQNNRLSQEQANQLKQAAQLIQNSLNIC